MRYDLLGVREFAEKLTLTGGLGSSGASAPLSKARKGVKLHKAVQKHLGSLHPDFAAEKQVLYKYILNSFIASIVKWYNGSMVRINS